MSTTAPALPPRAAVILRALASYWMSTTQVINRLHDQGFTFSPDIVRAQLGYLVANGHVTRDRKGASYYWRDTAAAAEARAARDAENAAANQPDPPADPDDKVYGSDREVVAAAFRPMVDAAADKADPLAPYITAVEQAVEAMRKRYAMPAAVAAPATPITMAELNHRTADHPLDNLLDLDAALLGRIVARAKYDALKTMLDTVEGWHEGAAENHVALDHHDDGDDCLKFEVIDVRRMVADAARAAGVRSPYRESDEA